MPSEERTPPNIHCSKVLGIRRLHDKFVHMTIHRERDRFSREKTAKFVAYIFQDTSRCLGYTYVGSTLYTCKLSASLESVVHSHLSWNEVCRWIVQECFKYCHQSIFILPKKIKAYFTCPSERSYRIGDIKLKTDSFLGIIKTYRYIHKPRTRLPCSE